MRGLVGALGLAHRAAAPADRAVWPHEEIHPEQAGELADRMHQMDLNPAPILLVHHGEQELRELIATVTHRRPDWRYLDRTGQRQRIWAIREADLLVRIGELLRETRSLLADGHHRYAAYLRLQQEHPGTGWDAGLAMLVDQHDTPLFLGAIHRTLPGTTLDALVEAARASGAEVSTHGRRRALGALDSTHLVLTDGSAWHTVSPSHLDREAAVSWLHDRVLPRLPSPATRVEHHHNVDDALAATSPSSPAVLLPNPDFEQVRALVESGGLLPEKATSFQPKPSLGAIMRPMTYG